MSYLTDTDKVIFLAGGVGLAVGIITNAQDIALDRWLKREWLGWDRAISRAIVSAIIWALVFSALAFLTMLYEPAKPLSAVQQSMIQFGLWMGLVVPGATRIGLWATDKIASRVKSNL